MIGNKLQIEIGATLSGNFSSTLKKGRDELSLLGRAIQQLETQNLQAQALTKLREKTEEARRTWKAAEGDVQTLAFEMQKAGTPTAELAQRFQEAKDRAHAAKDAFTSSQKELSDLTLTLQKAGVNTENLTQKQAALGAIVQKISVNYRVAQQHFQQAGQHMVQARQAMGQFVRLGMTAGATLGVPIKVAMDAEVSMINLGKALQTVGDKNVPGLEASLKKMTTTLSYSFKELTDLATLGARNGLVGEELLQWTEFAGKLAKVSGMTTEEIGTALTGLQGTFKLSIGQVKELGDTLDFLSSTTRISMPELLNSVNSMSGAAEQFGFSATQIAGFATAFAKAGYKGTEAVSIVKQLLPKLGLVANETNKTMVEAAQSLGIIPAELKKMMVDHPEDALVYALEKINAVPLQERAGTLSKIFGQRVQAEASKLAGQVDKLKEAFSALNAEGVKGSVDSDFAKIMAGAKEQTVLFKNALQGLGLEIGKSLLPGFTHLMQTLTGFFNTLSTFSQEHPQLFAALTKTVTVLFSVAGGLIAIKGAASVFKALSSWVLGGVSALKALWGLVLAHPFVAIGTAVVAAVALVIKHWDKVKAFFENLWEGLKMGFQSVVDFFKETFAKVWDWIVGKFNAIKDFFGNIGGKVGGFFKKLWPFGKKDEAIESAAEAPKSALADVTLSPPAHFQAANTNRTLNNNVTFHIDGANDPKTVAQEVEAAMKRVSGDVLYDRGVSGGFFTS